MILRCPKCQSPVDAPAEPGALATCSYCDAVSRMAGDELQPLRAWDAAIAPPDLKPPAPEVAVPPPAKPAEPPPKGQFKAAWKAPVMPVAAPLFPPADPKAAAQAMSPKPPVVEPPPVPVAERVRPLLKFAVPAVVGAVLLAAGILAWGKISATKGKEQTRPAEAGSQGTPVDPEAARKAALAEAVDAAEKKLAQGGAFGPAEVPALVELLSHSDLRPSVARALANLGEPAAAALPALIPLFDDPRAGPAAVEAASRIAPRSPEFREAVAKLLGGELAGTDPIPVRLAAIAACERLGADLAPTLGAGLRSPSQEIRDACTRALIGIGAPALGAALAALQWTGKPDAQAAATTVLQGLRDVSRFEAPRLLSEVGTHAPADPAIFALVRGMGPDVLPVVLQTLDAREEGPGEAAWDACQACLESFGPKAIPVVREWLEEHRIERPVLRARLTRAAGAWGRDAVPLLAPALADGDPGVRGAAVESLGRIGPGADEAWEALESGAARGDLDHRVAAAAVRIRGAEAIPLLVQLLQAGAAPTRVAAAQELGALGASAGPAVPDLIALFPDAALRPAALAALEKIGDPAVEGLVAALRHDLPETRTGAAAALGKIGPRTPAVTPALALALTDEVKEVRDAALFALMAMGTEGVNELEKALKHKSRAVRTLAVWALGQKGPAAAGTLPALKAALKDDNDAFREYVVKAMARMGPRAVPELSELLKHADAGVRESAAEALGGMGADAVAALPALKAAAQDREPAVQAAIEEAVRKLEQK